MSSKAPAKNTTTKPAATPAPAATKPASTPTKPAAPKPTTPTAPPATSPQVPAAPTEDKGTGKNFWCWLGAGITLLVVVPCVLARGNKEDDEPEPKVSGGKVMLDKLVGWVKEITHSDSEEVSGVVHPQYPDGYYDDVSSPIDYVKTQSV